MGTPVDPVPGLIRAPAAAASDAPGVPGDVGHAPAAVRGGRAPGPRRRRSRSRRTTCCRVVGTKEFVAWLPLMLGLGPGDVVLQPELAYPTYDIGARLPGDRGAPADSLLGRGCPALAWSGRDLLSNPTGRVLPPGHLRKVVAWAQERGAVVASDECYISLGWDAAPVSVLHPFGVRRGRTRACSRSTRCPSGPTWPVTGPGSSPATRRWSRTCSRSGNRPG